MELDFAIFALVRCNRLIMRIKARKIFPQLWGDVDHELIHRVYREKVKEITLNNTISLDISTAFCNLVAGYGVREEVDLQFTEGYESHRQLLVLYKTSRQSRIKNPRLFKREGYRKCESCRGSRGFDRTSTSTCLPSSRAKRIPLH